MKSVKLTKVGFAAIQKEYAQLKKAKLPDAVNRLQKARSMGDLKENSEYSAAKEGLAFVEGRILEIEEILKHVEVVENRVNGQEVSLGSIVSVECDGQMDEFCIVGEFEADPLKKRLSHTSPIGKALIGKKIGEIVDVDIPAGKTKYKIIKIH